MTNDVIKHRTVLMQRDSRKPSDGTFIRPLNWALVTTSLGAMVEPFMPFAQHSMGTGWRNYDATDECVRVDEIQFVDADRHMLILSGSNEQIHGGDLLPRVGK